MTKNNLSLILFIPFLDNFIQTKANIGKQTKLSKFFLQLQNLKLKGTVYNINTYIIEIILNTEWNVIPQFGLNTFGMCLIHINYTTFFGMFYLVLYIYTRILSSILQVFYFILFYIHIYFTNMIPIQNLAYIYIFTNPFYSYILQKIHHNTATRSCAQKN